MAGRQEESYTRDIYTVDIYEGTMPNEFSHIFMRGGDKVLKFKQRQCFLTTGERILKNEKDASSGNRTRAARVAGEHSTTEPTMLTCSPGFFQQPSDFHQI